jgi:hypothetical protein
MDAKARAFVLTLLQDNERLREAMKIRYEWTFDTPSGYDCLDNYLGSSKILTSYWNHHDTVLNVGCFAPSHGDSPECMKFINDFQLSTDTNYISLKCGSARLTYYGGKFSVVGTGGTLQTLDNFDVMRQLINKYCSNGGIVRILHVERPQ